MLERPWGSHGSSLHLEGAQKRRENGIQEDSGVVV